MFFWCQFFGAQWSAERWIHVCHFLGFETATQFPLFGHFLGINRATEIYGNFWWVSAQRRETVFRWWQWFLDFIGWYDMGLCSIILMTLIIMLIMYYIIHVFMIHDMYFTGLEHERSHLPITVVIIDSWINKLLPWQDCRFWHVLTCSISKSGNADLPKPRAVSAPKVW